MSNRSDGFMYLVRVITTILKTRARCLEAQIESLGNVKVVLCIIIQLLLFDQVILFFQEPRATLPLYEVVARKTNSLIGTCKVSKIELLSNQTIPKQFDIENQNFYLVSNFVKKRKFLFFYEYKRLDNKYVLYEELLSDSLLMYDYFSEKIPSIKYVRDSKETRKFTPIVPSHLVEVSDINSKDSIKLDIVERFWKGDVKLIGNITLVCNCEAGKNKKINSSSNYHK